MLSVTVCTVGYIFLFRGDQFFVDFVSFLSMIICEALYTVNRERFVGLNFHGFHGFRDNASLFKSCGLFY